MASTSAAPRAGLFANRWWIVWGSLIGNIVGPGPAVIFVTNVFMLPVTSELGWTRGEFSAGLLASAVASPIMTPFFGWLMDRHGIQKVVLPTAYGPIRLDKNHQGIIPVYYQQLYLKGGKLAVKTVGYIPNVDQTFGGTFSASTPAPGRTSPKCVKRSLPWIGKTQHPKVTG